MAKKTPARNTRRTPTTRRKSPPVPRHRWRIPLNGLVRLNWADSIDVPPQSSILEGGDRIWLNDQAYQIESLDPDGRSPLRLAPNKHYRAIPLDESDQPRRYLLVRQQKSFSSQRTYLVVSESAAEDGTSADKAIAHIHILGGYADKQESRPDVKEPRIVGVAEAILTPIGSLESGEPTETPTAEPSADEEQPPAAPVLPLDEDLLQCIDWLNSLQERYPAAENDLAEAQKQFHDYVQRRYNLEVIPIFRGQTAYDENQGHCQASVSRFSKVDDGIITAVRSDGYRRDTQEVARPAQVVVNHHATHIVKLKRMIIIRPGRLYVELYIPAETRRNRIFLETALQAGTLDLLYSWLAWYVAAQASDFRQVFGQSDQQPSDDLMRDTLLKVHDWPLRLVYLGRSSQLYLMMHGEAEALQVMHNILQAEALHRDNIRCHVEPDWPLDELRQLRPNAPAGLKIQEFNEMTAQFLTRIRELLEQIAFAPEFVA